MHQSFSFLGQVGSGVQDMGLSLLGNFELNSQKCHSLILRPILIHKSAVIFTQQVKMIDSNNFTLSSMFSF